MSGGDPNTPANPSGSHNQHKAPLAIASLPLAPRNGKHIHGAAPFMTGKELRAFRKARGWSQAKLGASLETPYTQATISDWERGRKPIPLEAHESLGMLEFPKLAVTLALVNPQTGQILRLH